MVTAAVAKQEHEQAPASEISLYDLRDVLDRMFPDELWENLEVETITLHLGILPDDLLLAKIRLLIALEREPRRFYKDPLFMMYAISIMNNDPHFTEDNLPWPNSLEIAYAFQQFEKLFPHYEILPEAKTAVEFFLKEEGYTYPVYPFDKFLSKEDLAPDGREPGTLEENADKAKAIVLYLQLMNKGA